MQKVRAVLRMSAEGEEELLEAEGTCSLSAAGERLYRFAAEGGHFFVRAGACVRIERRGGIAYAFDWQPLAETPARIATPYGEIAAAVYTHALECGERDGAFRIAADYELRAGGQAQRRFAELRFVPAAGERGGARS